MIASLMETQKERHWLQWEQTGASLISSHNSLPSLGKYTYMYLRVHVLYTLYVYVTLVVYLSVFH